MPGYTIKHCDQLNATVPWIVDAPMAVDAIRAWLRHIDPCGYFAHTLSGRTLDIEVVEGGSDQTLRYKVSIKATLTYYIVSSKEDDCGKG